MFLLLSKFVVYVLVLLVFVLCVVFRCCLNLVIVVLCFLCLSSLGGIVYVLLSYVWCGDGCGLVVSLSLLGVLLVVVILMGLLVLV